jgi:hypothetical protein
MCVLQCGASRRHIAELGTEHPRWALQQRHRFLLKMNVLPMESGKCRSVSEVNFLKIDSGAFGLFALNVRRMFSRGLCLRLKKKDK